MRGAFAATLTALAETDSRIFLLTGDLGYMALEPFANKFPERFINVGVAEQNMVGIATGLAEAGFLPFVYSIVTFATLRPYEFIRNGPILQHLPVRIVGVGGGVEYAHNGASHYGLEDIAVMRTQPGMTVVAPADAEQTKNALRATYDLPQPVYYRLGKDDKTIVPGLNGEFTLGKIQKIRDGSDLVVVSLGAIAAEANRACDLLWAQGIKASLLLVSSFNPSPTRDLANYLQGFDNVITLEAHYASGGLASFVSEVIAQEGISCKLTRCAVENTPDGITGSQKFMHERLGISAESVQRLASTLKLGALF
ncbi:MAG: transketolase C-terminal domain-containing protein [Candidatus Obscuribacterales bacterium]|nr:transketolase C-terminal domain-containing protein [Candidatus Obscuribacterales bacterium]